MSDIFVSLDVETSGPCPSIGELATIGAVAYDSQRLRRISDLYIRIQSDARSEPDYLDEWNFEPSTYEFWTQQDETVRAEAFAPGLDRVSRRHAAGQLTAWAQRLPGTPVFVAHPVGFDWAWINQLILSNVGPNATHNPFGYRPLCLRSLAWALTDTTQWATDRTDDARFHVPSATPHHALADAEAQGATLIKILEHIRAPKWVAE